MTATETAKTLTAGQHFTHNGTEMVAFATGVDHYVVTDNGDVEILARVAAGGPVEVLQVWATDNLTV